MKSNRSQIVGYRKYWCLIGVGVKIDQVRLDLGIKKVTLLISATVILLETTLHWF